MPPVVVSGLPNITPIFCRNWLVNTIAVFVCLIAPDSLRSAWLISPACIPIVASPISPSISARGTSAATLSTTTTSTAPLRPPPHPPPAPPPRHQRRHAVHHHHFHRPAPHQRLGDLQRLLPRVRLRDVQVVHVHPALRRIPRVQ